MQKKSIKKLKMKLCLGRLAEAHKAKEKMKWRFILIHLRVKLNVVFKRVVFIGSLDDDEKKLWSRVNSNLQFNFNIFFPPQLLIFSTFFSSHNSSPKQNNYFNCLTHSKSSFCRESEWISDSFNCSLCSIFPGYYIFIFLLPRQRWK